MIAITSKWSTFNLQGIARKENGRTGDMIVFIFKVVFHGRASNNCDEAHFASNAARVQLD